MSGNEVAEFFIGVYSVGYSIWNHLMSVALTLFTTSPTAASGAVYSITYSLYTSINDIAIPIAIVFFLLAIIQDVITTPPDQQVRRFLGDAVKFGVLIGILCNLWEVLGYIIQIADGITAALAAGSSCDMAVSDELKNVINDACELPEWTGITEIGNFCKEAFVFMINVCIFLITSIVTLIIVVASAIMILTSAFQRILKPLVILPFASVTVAMASGTGEASRVASNYIKTLFSLCISGAFMVICIKLGAALSSGLVVFSFGSLGNIEKILYVSIQNAIVPMMIAGLVKSSESILGKFL